MKKGVNKKHICLKSEVFRMGVLFLRVSVGTCGCVSSCVKGREMRAKLEADRGPGIIQWWKAATDNYTYGHWGS